MTRTALSVALCTVVLWAGTAAGLTDEEKCVSRRALANDKFEQCVARWLVRGYAHVFNDARLERRCRRKYTAAWTKLQQLAGSPTCGGQPRYVDNGDGTVTDNLSGLVWEKKSSNGDVHDWQNQYTWSTGDPYGQDGTVFTSFLTAGLNAGGGFAGANDWRLPTLTELLSIAPEDDSCELTTCVAGPIDPVFDTGCTPGCSVTACSCAPFDMTWTSSTAANDASYVWSVSFGNGNPYSDYKTSSKSARAVRGGF